jgi:LCP family protein required for cell wall assembly
MRTTLKRGIGRGAEVNGNGRAVYPPGVLTPVRRYLQPPPPRRTGLQVLWRFMGWALAAVVLLVGGLAGGAYLYAHETVKDLRARTPAVRAAAKQLDVELPGHAAIALVIGYDKRKGVEAGGPSRSDTVMLVRADPVTKTVSMLSFPRDLWVEIHCPGRGVFASRINQAYETCGPKGTLLTVKTLTKLPINYLVTVDFHGFKSVVNKLHGVYLDIDRRYYNPHGTGFAAINLHAGYQKLNGQQALDFVRYRHTDSDFYRLARQQSFVKAFKQRVSDSISIRKLPGLIRVITQNVEVARGGKDIDLDTALSWANFLYHLPSGHFFQPKIENFTENGAYDVLATQQDIDAGVSELVNPDVDAGRKATAVALGRKLRTKAPKPVETSVTVLNGNGVAGSAGNAAFSLAQRGYRILEPRGGAVANAPNQNYFHTKIYFDPRLTRAKAAATAVQNLFPPADVHALPRPIRRLSKSMVTVVVGQTFDGELAAAPQDKTPKRQPPQVRFDPSAQEAALREVRASGFRLMVPTVIESGSRLDYEEPARRYRIARGHWAVRMVFRTGGSEYWGIEETDWTDAPALADRSFRHVLGKKSKRRTYDFYYSGPHLHMIVLRSHGATYWVVNTLLDRISNETMIAIAKGLTPLKRN